MAAFVRLFLPFVFLFEDFSNHFIKIDDYFIQHKFHLFARDFLPFVLSEQTKISRYLGFKESFYENWKRSNMKNQLYSSIYFAAIKLTVKSIALIHNRLMKQKKIKPWNTSIYIIFISYNLRMHLQITSSQ